MQMRIFVNATLMVTFAGLGLASGYLWRTHSGKDAALASGTAAAHTTEPNAGKRILPGSASDDSPLATQLERDLAASSGVTKWLCWMSALEKAQPVDFPRLLKLATGNPAAWHVVANRWIETAPRHLYDTLVAEAKAGSGFLSQELARELFRQWPRRDPEAAIAALSEPDDAGITTAWRMEVASAVIEAQPERGLALMSDWHIENYGPNMNAVEAWAAADPQHAAQFAMAHYAGYASQLAMETIGQVWAGTDPTGALDFALSQNGALASTLANAVLKQWAAKDLNAASDWLAFADQSTVNRLSPAFVETWAKQDSAAALSWCQENLDGIQLSQAVSAVMKGAADKDVTQAAAMVSGMQPGPARSAAALVVAQKWFPNFPNGDPVNAQAISWLSGLDTDSAKQALGQVGWVWAQTDPKSMASFLSSASSDEVPPYTDSTLARQMARTTPVQALDWAASLPGSRALPAGGDAFAEWRQSQPAAAMEWLEALPQNDPRYQPYFDKMIESLAYTSQAAEQLSAMTPSEQAAAQTVIAKMTLPDDQRARLLASLKSR